MKIRKLHVRNFKKFAEQSFELHEQFTLLVGENGSGKTSVLDALAVAAGVWLLDVPDSDVKNSQRSIDISELRLEPRQDGDRILFQEASNGVEVRAQGTIGDQQGVTWSREIPAGKLRTTNQGAEQARKIILSLYKRSQDNDRILLPIVAYYGAGRAWLPHRERSKTKAKSNGQARRWAAFYDCLNERIRLADLADWFKREAIAAVNLGGKFRPGFEIVRHAVLHCVPGADAMWYDGDRQEIVLSIKKHAQPLSNLSAGQRMMLALVADIAIKAVTQNNFLVPPDAGVKAEDSLPPVLAQTPGVVLIDEIDVHLHPRWQRRVASDLKRTFPLVQFVCTSHSPQVIGELSPGEIRLLDEPNSGRQPAHSVGLDSNAVLEEVMGAESRSQASRVAIDAVEQALESGDLNQARQRLTVLRDLQYGETSDSARLQATINNLEALADAGD